MKILVFSDSHGLKSFMRLCIKAIKPDLIVHLGDYFDDGSAVAEENPQIRVYQVPGNCDRHRLFSRQPEIMCCNIGGVKVFMSHGHMHAVKSGNGYLLADAQKRGAQVVLYGHTHCPECTRNEDGVWVLNPGTCGGYGGSVGLIEIQEEKVSSCRILRQEDLL